LRQLILLITWRLFAGNWAMSNEVSKDIIREINDDLVKIYPNLFKYAMALLGDKYNAEDAVMTSITSFLVSFKRNQEKPKSLTAYLITTIKNQINTDYKKAKRLELVEDFDDMLAPDSEVKSDPLVRKRLLKEFGELKPECREILALSALGHSYSEISEILNVVKNTVASRLFNCRNSFGRIWHGSKQAWERYQERVRRGEASRRNNLQEDN
jgi:RNA polymerase sigma factor (sigma-70 family)